MKAQAFDGISRDLGQVSTRRSMTRLLSGVVALSAVVLGGRGEAEAKKKNKKKAKGKKGKNGKQDNKGKKGKKSKHKKRR